MYISDFKLVDILRDKMGEDEARALVEYIENQVEDKFTEARKVFATKEDLLRLELKITETIHKGDLETQKLIAESRAQSEKLFADSKALIIESRNNSDKLFAESKADSDKLFADSKSHSDKLFADSKLSSAESKTEILKWMFTMILTASVAIIGTILTVLKMGGWVN